MAEGNTGFIFTQSGVPVRGSADYQRVIDSRWRFMEIAQEVELRAYTPAATPVDYSARYFQEVHLFDHNLGFLPAFETDLPEAGGDGGFAGYLWADEKSIFLRRLINTVGGEERDAIARIRVYNVPILEEYEAPKGLPQGLSSPRGPAGIKFLERRTKGVDISDNSPVGFSVDTTKKALAIHKHGLAEINEAFGHTARVTAVNTTTNVITITVPPVGYPYANDISWFQQVGRGVAYQNVDFPAPLVGNQTYYVIPLTPTTLQLANSYDNAINGIPIDLTTTGTIAADTTLSGRPGVDDNKIFHEVGYPPTFLLANTNWEDQYYDTAPPTSIWKTKRIVGPLINNPPTFMRADNETISFFGVQAIFYGKYGYIILKDPAEIAQ